MNGKRSRLALLGVLALTLSVTVGLLSGGVADAKKKKGNKGNTVTVSKTTPTTIPAATSLGGGNVIAGRVDIPLTVGKKGKGKLVAFSSPSLTFSLSAGLADVLDDISAFLISPNHRKVFLIVPDDDDVIFIGPLTQTPDSEFGLCEPDAAPPPPPCPDPEDSLTPPYAGTIGNVSLAFFGGVPVRGTWTARFINFNTLATAVVASIILRATVFDKEALL